MVLRVTADLRLDVNGIRAQVSTVGEHIVVDTDEPWAVVREAARARRVSGLRGADLVLPGPLTATRVVLRGPHGDVAHVPLRDGRRVRRRDVRVQRPQDLLSPARGRVLLAAALGVTTAVLIGWSHRSRT